MAQQAQRRAEGALGQRGRPEVWSTRDRRERQYRATPEAAQSHINTHTHHTDTHTHTPGGATGAEDALIHRHRHAPGGAAGAEDALIQAVQLRAALLALEVLEAAVTEKERERYKVRKREREGYVSFHGVSGRMAAAEVLQRECRQAGGQAGGRAGRRQVDSRRGEGGIHINGSAGWPTGMRLDRQSKLAASQHRQNMCAPKYACALTYLGAPKYPCAKSSNQRIGIA